MRFCDNVSATAFSLEYMSKWSVCRIPCLLISELYSSVRKYEVNVDSYDTNFAEESTTTKECVHLK